ncbi:MAG: hypothetical protein J0I92_12550, partial [Phyllobacterium sp.]|nr:hypothetical protein [Phyllobacterium sp.]
TSFPPMPMTCPSASAAAAGAEIAPFEAVWWCVVRQAHHEGACGLQSNHFPHGELVEPRTMILQSFETKMAGKSRPFAFRQCNKPIS